MVQPNHYRAKAILALLALLALAVACAKTEKAVAPTPSPAPAPAAAVSASSPPAPVTPAPATLAIGLAAFLGHPEGQPLVPGGPPFFPRKLAQTKAIGLLFQYDQTTAPLWTKAKYGGQFEFGQAWVPNQALNSLKFPSLNRPTLRGMALYVDMGLCSMVGRESHFETCDGQYGNNSSIVLIPGIVQKWEQPGPLTYLFTVRKGVLWPAIPPMNRANREVTAEDIAWFLSVIKQEGVLKDNFALTKTIEAVDRYTVKVTMQEPHADFLLNMANTSMGIFPKECYDEKDCLDTKLISPSPFLLTQSVPREVARFERNPEFFLKGLPYLDGMHITNITDPAALKAAFITGKITTYLTIQDEGEAKALRARVPGSRMIARATFVGGGYRVNPKGPLADVRVRRALAMTMDHQSMWEVALGGFSYFPTLVPSHLFGPSFFMTLDQAGEWYQLNPQRAKQLLTEAGYPDGLKVTINYPSSQVGKAYYSLILANQASWKKYLGADVVIQTVDDATLSQKFLDGSWQDLYWAAGNNVTFWADGDSGLLQLVAGSRYDTQKVDDSVITELHRQQRSEIDPAKRAALLWRFEQHELSQVYFLRQFIPFGFNLYQPWELNCVSHAVAYCTPSVNGSNWVAMVDSALQLK